MTCATRSLVWICLFAMAACAAPPSDDRAVYAAPARDFFPPVGDVLGSHCGSLDCHGHPARNLRIYSLNGQRLEGMPGTGVTTPAEYDLTYISLIAIDPEPLALVLNERGNRPERWIVFSKGRGGEAHVGGTAMAKEGAADHCVTSWLAGALDEAACADAAELLPPGTR
jgi:hypothetical protein